MEKVEVEFEEGLIVVKPEGEIAHRTYPEFEDNLENKVEEGIKVQFDMKKVTFFSSLGVVFLLKMKEMVESKGGKFEIFRLKSNLKSSLKKMSLEKFLNVK